MGEEEEEAVAVGWLGGGGSSSSPLYQREGGPAWRLIVGLTGGEGGEVVDVGSRSGRCSGQRGVPAPR